MNLSLSGRDCSWNIPIACNSSCVTRPSAPKQPAFLFLLGFGAPVSA